MMESDVCDGRISTTIGVQQVVDFARRLLADHQLRAMESKQQHYFDQREMRALWTHTRHIEKQAYRLNCYDSDEECCDGVGMYNIWKGYLPNTVKKKGGKKGKKGQSKVGYVGPPETFGDAELSDSDANSIYSTVQLTDCDTTSSSVTRRPVNKGHRIRNEEKAFEKICKNHQLSIVVLPELYKRKVWKKVADSRIAISNRGYSALDAWEDVKSVAGKLRTNCEFQKLLREISITCG